MWSTLINKYELREMKTTEEKIEAIVSSIEKINDKVEKGNRLYACVIAETHQISIFRIHREEGDKITEIYFGCPFCQHKYSRTLELTKKEKEIFDSFMETKK